MVVNEEGHAEIIDFGSARMLESPDLEETLRWASPESIKEGAGASLESDIWSLGLTFWEVGPFLAISTKTVMSGHNLI